MLIIRCPQCHKQYDVGPIAEEAIEYRLEKPNNPALKVACPHCGQCLRLPEKKRVPSDQIPVNELREMMGRSLLIDHDTSDSPAPFPGTRRSGDYETDPRSLSGKRSCLLAFGIMAFVMFMAFLIGMGWGFIRKNHAPPAEKNQSREPMVPPPPLLNPAPNNDLDELQKKQFERMKNFDEESQRRILEFQTRIKDDSDSKDRLEKIISDLREWKIDKAYQCLSDNMKKRFPDVGSFQSFITPNFFLKDQSHHLVHLSFKEKGDAQTRIFEVIVITFKTARHSRYRAVMKKVDSQWYLDEIEKMDDRR